MSILNEAARAAITGGHLGHLATVNADGSPQLSAIWIGLDGDDIVSGHSTTGRSCATSVATRG